jgi:hypothetical protein
VSSAGGTNIDKTMFIDVKSFHQVLKSGRKLSVISIPRNQVWLAICNRNNKNITQMY